MGLEELTPEAVIVEQNMETLRAEGELGEQLAHLYELALTIAPDLKKAVIKPSAVRAGYIHHQGSTDGLHPEVYIHTKDGLQHYRELLSSATLAAEIHSTRAGIDPKKLTPAQLASLIFLHELGHAHQALTTHTDFDAWQERHTRELNSLPVPGFNASGLESFLATKEGEKWFSDNAQALYDIGVTSIQELVALQRRKFRDLESEKYADEFSAKILALDRDARVD